MRQIKNSAVQKYTEHFVVGVMLYVFVRHKDNKNYWKDLRLSSKKYKGT